MSRFSPSRAGAIAVWTGAAVVWGSTVVAGPLQSSPTEVGSSADEEAVVAIPADNAASMPTLPATGLIIIRVPTATPHRQTDVAERQTTPQSVAIVPQPTSSGS